VEGSLAKDILRAFKTEKNSRKKYQDTKSPYKDTKEIKEMTKNDKKCFFFCWISERQVVVLVKKSSFPLPFLSPLPKTKHKNKRQKEDLAVVSFYCLQRVDDTLGFQITKPKTPKQNKL